jgi:16S rRNA processing protein RimM
MPTRQSNPDSLIIMGHLGRSFGIHGWLHVYSFADTPTDLFNYNEWQIQHRGQWRSVAITDHQAHGNNFIVKLAGCDTPEAARLYANNPIAILKEQLPDLVQDYYWADLVGLQVTTIDGTELGIIDHLLETGSNDVMVIKPKDANKRQYILPYTDDVVKSIDLAHKQMVVDWDINF